MTHTALEGVRVFSIVAPPTSPTVAQAVAPLSNEKKPNVTHRRWGEGATTDVDIVVDGGVVRGIHGLRNSHNTV